MAKNFKIVTLTKSIEQIDLDKHDWISDDSQLSSYLQHGYEIEQIATASAAEGKISLTVLLSIHQQADLVEAIPQDQ